MILKNEHSTDVASKTHSSSASALNLSMYHEGESCSDIGRMVELTDPHARTARRPPATPWAMEPGVSKPVEGAPRIPPPPPPPPPSLPPNPFASDEAVLRWALIGHWKFQPGGVESAAGAKKCLATYTIAGFQGTPAGGVLRIRTRRTARRR